MRLDEQEIFHGDDDAGQPRAFRSDELTTCGRCGRRSPPTRMTCLYCGTPLPAPPGGADLRRPALRTLEEGERGFNVVLLPRESGSAHDGDATRGAEVARVGEGSRDAGGEDDRARVGALNEAASLVRIDPERLAEMIGAGVPLPLARTGEREEAALVERRLAAAGLPVEIVPDEELAADDEQPRRVRRFEFGESYVTGHGVAGAEPRRAAWADLVLIVAGRIYRKRIEVEERARRAGASEVVDARELAADEAVVDLYFAGERAGARVSSESFDFSCLGARMGLLASENFARLVAELRARAPRAAFDDSYARVRHLLRFAWPPASRAEAGGLRHTSPGRFTTGAVTSVTNEQQFTRYSRLLRRFNARAAAQTETTTEWR